MTTVIKVINSNFVLHRPQIIPKNTVNAEQVALDLDSSWDKLQIFAYWANIDAEIEFKVELSDPSLPHNIPWEIMRDAGRIRFGLIGMDGDTVVKPTILLNYGEVVDGADPNIEDTTTPPTPGYLEQMVALQQQAAEAAQEAQEAAADIILRADNGEFNGTPGTDGQDGVSPQISVLENTDESYRLRITDVSGVTDTPNLKGEQGEPGEPGADGQNGRDGLTTSVNGIEQVDGNIDLTLENIPVTGNAKYTELVNRIVLNPEAVQITVDKNLQNQAFALKSLKVNIFIPENNVPNGNTGTSIRALINNINDENSYSNNGTAAAFLSLGQLRTAGHTAQINMDVVGSNGKYVLIGINPVRSFYNDGGIHLTAERYSASTLSASSVWEYINSISIFSSSESYPLPVGTTVEVWGY